jgi:signal transduction histidine kinase/ligand-binding sensor domain-containing protein
VTLTAIRLNPWRLPTLLLLFFGTFSGYSATTGSAWLTRVKQTGDGLPHNHVYAIAQAADGYLWVGTPNALARFDGDRFTGFPFRELDASDEHNQGVRRILCGRDGGLWIVPLHGAVIHLSADYSQASCPQIGVTNVEALAMTEDKDGALWIVYGNGVIIRWQDGKTTTFADYEGVQRGNISLITDTSGRIWLGQGHNLAFFRNGHFETARTFKSNIRVAPGRTNGVWVVAGEQLYKYDTEHGVQDFGSAPADSPRAIGTVLIEDSDGAVWIGTDSAGLFRHSDSGFEKIETSYPNIWSLAEDRDHSIWVGTGGGGLNRITRRGVQLEGVLTETSLVGIESVCQDKNGLLWGVTQDGSVVCRHDGKWTTAFTNTLEAASCVAADASGAIWIGTRNKVLYRWHDGQFTSWNPEQGIVGSHIVTLVANSKGDLWIGEHLPDAVQCLHNGVLRRLTPSGKSGKINGMAEDAAGNIWVGTANGLLLRAEGDRLVDETPPTSTPHRIIRSLYATPDGALWIGYDGWGLACLKDKQFRHLGVDQGLPDDYIAQIIADDHGWLWFGGREQGLFKIRQQQLEDALANSSARVRPVFYGSNEGLASKEAIGWSPSAIRSCDGRLWIPMRTELAVADPKLLREQPEPPPVFLTRMAVDSQPIAAYGGITVLSHTANLKTLEDSVRVGPRHRKLEFEFAALNFVTPENLHFRYRLEGVDDDWVDIGRQRSVTYSRLNAGSYRFHVSASTGDGPWNETRVPLGIIVTPFFWDTWWFRSGVLILFTAAVVGAVRYFSFRRLHQQLRMVEQQAALDKERARIARDLHDDLGSSLMYVALVLEMNEQKSPAQNSAEGSPQLCSPLVRRVVQSVDEIIWAINPRNDQLKYLLDYIIEYAVEFLHAASIRTKVDVPDSVPQQTVSPEVRHNLFLVVKEALNNIARHSQASEVRFQIVADEKQIGITIQDNGKGFAFTGDKASADGMRNMRQRMEEIDGEFHIESKPGEGTRIALLYSLKHNHRALLPC